MQASDGNAVATCNKLLHSTDSSLLSAVALSSAGKVLVPVKPVTIQPQLVSPARHGWQSSPGVKHIEVKALLDTHPLLAASVPPLGVMPVEMAAMLNEEGVKLFNLGDGDAAIVFF